MMKALCFLLAALLLACGEPVPVQISSIREAESGEHAEMVDQAFEILGLDWVETDRVRGTLHLTIVDLGDDEALGTTSIRDARCWKAATAAARPQSIAHEAAHLLGLGHSCEGDACEGSMNLMTGSTPGGEELSDEQREQLEKGRRKLTRCR